MGLFGKKKDIDANVYSFKPTKIIGSFLLDEEKRKWMTADAITGSNGARVYDYDEILEYELIENDAVVTKGGVGGALAGGLLLGGVGAVVGGLATRNTKSVVNSIKIKITVKDEGTPAVFVNLLTGPIENSSPFYQKASKNAQEILSTLAIIVNENGGGQSGAVQHSDPTEEIKKYKKLLDMEAITQEEFDAKKKQLLGL